MKPTSTGKIKRNNRIVSHTAAFGPIEAKGATKAEAITAAETATLAALARLDRSTHILSWNGHIAVVSPDANGWRYWVDTFGRADYYISCGGVNDTRESVMDAAISHLADTVWTSEVDDETFLALLPERMRGEKRKRYQWYRDMRAFMDMGYTDTQARELIDQGSRPGTGSVLVTT